MRSPSRSAATSHEERHDHSDVLGQSRYNRGVIADDLEPFARYYTLIFYDQRGSGRSTLVADSAELTGKRFADDLNAVRQHFRLDRLTLLGHSWGSGLAALFAIQYPDRVSRMLLVGSMSPMRSGLAQVFSRLNAGRDSLGQRRLREARTAWYADTGSAAVSRPSVAESSFETCTAWALYFCRERAR